MAKSRITLNRRNIGAILSGKEGDVKKELERRADRVIGALGEGWTRDTQTGPHRVRVGIYATEEAGFRTRARRPQPATLLRALDAARD